MIQLPCLARLSLLLALMACLGHIFLVENPASSIVVEHPRLIWVVKTLRKAGVVVLCQQLIRLGNGLRLGNGNGTLIDHHGEAVHCSRIQMILFDWVIDLLCCCFVRKTKYRKLTRLPRFKSSSWHKPQTIVMVLLG